jgi:hypothetical protein
MCVSSENFFRIKFFHENSTHAELYNSTAVLENDWLSWLNLARCIIQISPFILIWHASGTVKQLALCGYLFRTSAKITVVKTDVILHLSHSVHENRLRLLSHLLFSILYRQNSTRRNIQQATPFKKQINQSGTSSFLPFITECSPS